MSLLLIQNYYNEVDKLIQYGGSRKETSIRRAFENLLNEYAKKRNLLLVPELDYKTAAGKTVFPDGTLKDAMRLDWGYWESKDEADDLDKEIKAKFAKGYPDANILFEDSVTAVLIQAGKEVHRIQMRDAAKLDALLIAFVSFERPEIRSFRQAIEQVKSDLPSVSKALRELIRDAQSPTFLQARAHFFELCKQVINPEITPEDINEMLIQHILTEDIFKSIYNESQYHEENNIAQELKKLEMTFFKGDVKRNMLDKIRPYYQFIQEQGKSIINHTEKKAFLNAVYEDFYKAYNPKMADKLGVVYTPQEIVQFMIESTEFLLDKHFNLTLSDKNVHILDPATGTGTFVCALIEHLDSNALAYKYENELFANEVSILPYYIANLNIEYTYRQRQKTYKEFTNLCFVDTLDNISALKYAGKQTDFFGFSTENAERIKRQNDTKISVIIGNPPYNAKQENFNDNNANRKYPAIDKRIKETYIKEGTAQNQIAIYDAYVRFFRWATDRLDKNGVLAFVSNSSFIDAASFDGFRKIVAKEFNEVWIINLKGNARTSGERRRQEGGNIFDDKIRVGVAIYFFVKNEKLQNCKIYYNEVKDYAEAKEKLDYISESKLMTINFERSLPDTKGNWINQTDNDFDTLIPLCSKEVKAGKGSNKAIFELFSSGVKSQRDEWVYDFDKNNLENKINFFVDVYQHTLKNKNYADKYTIKWDTDLESYLNRGIEKKFDKTQIVKSIYRPYVAQWFYFDKHFNGRTYQWYNIFNETKNVIIAIPGLASPKDFHTLAVKPIIDLNALPAGGQCLPRYRYDNAGKPIDNITDWALDLFRAHYGVATQNTTSSTHQRTISKEDIFHYVYAVLHNPAYRQKYEQNLKRDFPRIPLYADFWAWASLGKELMDLHLHYESAGHYPLLENETSPTAATSSKAKNKSTENQLSPSHNLTTLPKPKLKAHKEAGELIIDDTLSLIGVPAIAWEYKLGNRSALEWVLDQYKESTPSDATIAAHFDTYCFADYKTHVIDLLKCVCQVSVATMHIIARMKDL